MWALEATENCSYSGGRLSHVPELAQQSCSGAQPLSALLNGTNIAQEACFEHLHASENISVSCTTFQRNEEGVRSFTTGTGRPWSPKYSSLVCRVHKKRCMSSLSISISGSSPGGYCTTVPEIDLHQGQCQNIHPSLKKCRGSSLC